jgi:hypothetical protein
MSNYITFNVTQQDTKRKFPDDEVHTSKHVGAVECISNYENSAIVVILYIPFVLVHSRTEDYLG